MQPQFDEIGYWSQIKLDILRKYATAYSTILASQKHPPLHHAYIDAFAGAGVQISKATGELVPGSPLNALLVQPPFREYHLIDVDGARVDNLRELTRGREDVRLYKGNCNTILLEEVFPLIRYEDYRRGLCLLDPYGLHLEWRVVETAGRMKTIDLFLNFPVMDMNRNILRRRPEGVRDSQIIRMNSFWGNGSWRYVAYKNEPTLFGEHLEKQRNETIAEAFRHRLQSVAGFARVPAPLPMVNSVGAVVYYLFFASQKDTAENIVLDIFNKYRRRGGV